MKPGLVALLLFFTAAFGEREKEPGLKDGDIIFQVSLSGQSRAIQAATGSKWSHCGIIYRTGNGFVVFEAVQPVKFTPLKQWIVRGKEGRYTVKRLKADSLLTTHAIERMKKEGAKLRGKNYDLTFEWSDDSIYCSELVWKIYKRALGLEIGKVQQLKEFNLEDMAVKKKLRERYGAKIPLNEPVISPSAVFNSGLLKTVIEK